MAWAVASFIDSRRHPVTGRWFARVAIANGDASETIELKFPERQTAPSETLALSRATIYVERRNAIEQMEPDDVVVSRRLTIFALLRRRVRNVLASSLTSAQKLAQITNALQLADDALEGFDA
jgi:hypothetical protein